MPTFYDRLKKAASILFDAPQGQIAADHGRIAETESLFHDPNPDATWQNEGASYFARMAENDWIWAAMDYRDVSRLWVGAAEIKDINPLTGEEYVKHPGQLICPPGVSDAMSRFLEWQLDDRLDRPVEEIFAMAQRCYLQYGFAPLEVIWRNEKTPHGARSVICDIQDVDPDRIILRRVWASDGTPVSEEQQATYRMHDFTVIKPYLKKYYSGNEDLIEFPPNKLALLTNKGQFGNPYGQSEFKPLVRTEYSMRQISQFWDKHLERYGSPQMVHTYSADREGAQWDTWRKNQLAAIAKAQNQTILQISEKGQLEALSGTGETQSFLDRMTMLQQSISIVLCGSATALMEGKTGARAKEEATTVRQKAAREQYDCSLLEACFNYQIIPWLIDINFGVQDVYPYIQIIPPEDITPTTPEGQQQHMQSQVMLKGDGSKDNGGEEIVQPGANEEAEKRKEDETGVKEMAEEEPEDSKIGGFPERRTPNPLYKDKTVQEEAWQVIGGLTVYTKKEFDKLTDAEKKDGFTFAGMPEDKEKIAELLQIYLESVSIPNERQAFLWVRKQIKLKDWLQTYSDRELMPSFRYARDKGYNAGIIAKARGMNDVYALQYVTKDDPDVRWNHAKMHKVIQPIDSEFWKIWQPPNGFGCRCSIKIITQAMHLSNPKKYTITDWKKNIKPDKGW